MKPTKDETERAKRDFMRFMAVTFPEIKLSYPQIKVLECVLEAQLSGRKLHIR
jgi:hypothetical protein